MSSKPKIHQYKLLRTLVTRLRDDLNNTDVSRRDQMSVENKSTAKHTSHRDVMSSARRHNEQFVPRSNWVAPDILPHRGNDCFGHVVATNILPLRGNDRDRVLGCTRHFAPLGRSDRTNTHCYRHFGAPGRLGWTNAPTSTHPSRRDTMSVEKHVRTKNRRPVGTQ